jgi:hypothetical protein
MIDKPSWRYFFLALLGCLLGWLGWRLGKLPSRPQPVPRPQPGQQPVPQGMSQAQFDAMVQAQLQAQPEQAQLAHAQVEQVPPEQPAPPDGRIVSSVPAAPSSWSEKGLT